MKVATPAAIVALLLAATATWAQTNSDTSAPSAAPTILNAKPAGQTKNAPEPYAGQKPGPSPAPVTATPANPPAPVPATPPAAATAAPAEPASPAQAAASAAKAAAEAKPVPEGPAVKPIAKDNAAASPAASASPKTEPAKAETKSSSTETGLKGETTPVLAKPEPPKPTLLVAIDLSNQKLSVTENGTAKYKWSISSGRTGYITPRGTFRPVWMSKMWYSRKYDYAPMPHAIFFHGGTAIHGTDSVYALGRPASHGCVRLSPGNAATLYKLVTKHGKQKTQITVFGNPKQAPQVASNRDGDTRERWRERRYREEPWWNDEDDDYPPPARRRADRSDYGFDGPPPFSERPRARRYVRDYEPYDYDY